MNTELANGTTFPPLLKREVRNAMRRFLHSKNYTYDESIEDSVVNEVESLSVEYAFFAVYTHLKINKKGASFNYATAIAHILRHKGYNCGIVTTVNNDSIKVSVAYVYCGKLLVCDIIKYIKGEAGIAECSAIPFNTFKANATGRVCLYNLDAITGSYVNALCSCRSNISPEAFLSLPYFRNP